MGISPAKINLGLEVPFRREDGYHEIRSIFLKINFADSFEARILKEKGESRFHLVSKNLLKGHRFQLFEAVSERGDLSKNILWKSFQSLLPHLKTPIQVTIHLEKRIPPEGGIGGGSSNAGSFLAALFPYTDLEEADKLSIAKSIGADVPFFLQKSHCWVQGIGDILEPIEVGNGYGVLAIPPLSLSTKAMYAGLQKSLQRSPVSKVWKTLAEDVIKNLQVGAWKQLNGLLENEFEKVAFVDHPGLRDLKHGFFKNGAAYASLSGSGSCLYGLVNSQTEQTELLKAMTLQFPEIEFLSFAF
ncbi:4-diphosphocytidyl-2-C-methyl-D-erythritol kinase [Leptospira ryugenii]|uniref:4-diphosphocytidyl-2-C-methyl-D-erythritol kinase n=1 Tax=Leptospira ryugenii TaxID=1917863 RepID=A0A2P2E2L9_9LEPT|nr:4-(cytidine 5'-diphospho)-2-C-methyl-D-erythritol kinase [Leptospira ryugenii]GBF51127.1 4-diphosphocytidyl-2-C-methyl-D-erythritol kinase [Leptospira ryugenii]